jgi:glutaminyl-tRNA synthetase
MNNFITDIINSEDNKKSFRFPPEPNGFLHLGHAKSIHLNFSLAENYKGTCNLRFDDTNPDAESEEYVSSIIKDLEWLGVEPTEVLYASDYFDIMEHYALLLIEAGKAYVCDLTQDEWVEYRGVPTKPGKESPFRKRTIEENREIFDDMCLGKYEEGEKVLRLKLDMTSSNLHMRDPIIYRIKKTPHHRRPTNDIGRPWNVLPMYDYAHCISDAIEGITYSLCTLEFEVHRPLYDWIIDSLKELGVDFEKPRQIEFARLNVDYTVLSKRKLLELVEKGIVSGWTDPRMPTISAMRRRGYTAKAIFDFMDKVGIAKRENVIDVKLLEHSVREDLNSISHRRFAVLDPLKLIITNYPEDKTEKIKSNNNPEDESFGTRELTFSRELWIEKEDFKEEANRKYKRLVIGRDVRLKNGYIVNCTGCKKDDDGNILEVYAEYYPKSRSGSDNSGIKTSGTIHYVSSEDCFDAEVRLYDRLFKTSSPETLDDLNEESLIIKKCCKLENSLKEFEVGTPIQFERLGYFCVDEDSTKENPIFNRTIELRNKWT